MTKLSTHVLDVRIAALFKKGRHPKEIAVVLCRSVWTVYKSLERSGVKIRKRNSKFFQNHSFQKNVPTP